ncbi:MAG: penicillin acylase family protein [Pseudomonadota bacterium]
MKHWLFSVLLVALLSACAQRPAALDESDRLAERAARVEIIRDDFGVPHVYGETDADTVFGMLFAQAEDDFPRIERNYLWALGRLAEIEGDNALYSDLRARLFMTEAEARAAYAAAPGWLKALCQAWADGLNWYLETHPEVELRALSRFEPWMPMYFFEGSIGGDIERIPVAGVEAFYGEQRPVDPAVLATARDRHAGYEDPLGSNGFAIDGSRTRSGDAMLLINPHTSFYFRGEMHVVSGEGLNAYGAVTWGQFFIYQGFNERTGWMHTSTRADFMDEFAVEVVETDSGPKYRHGEELRDFESWDETIRVRRGDDIIERTFTLYRTHHGPVTHRIDNRWVATKINWDPARALEQSFVRTKQSGHAGFRAMMDIRTNSSNNTVYADAEGNIAYYHGNFMPRRDARFDWSKPVDGSDPATDWQGLHTVDETVWILNPDTGWLQNCNSTPFTAAGLLSPRREAYPTYMAPDLENFRGVRAVQLLQDAEDLTLDGLIDLAYDPTLVGFDALLGGLIEAWDAHADDHPALADPIAILRFWDRRVALDSVAMTLAHFYGMRYRDEGDRPEGLRGMALIEHFGRGSDPGERLRIFAETLTMLEADFGSWHTPWGEVNRFQRLSGAIDLEFDDAEPSLPVPMAANLWGALASFRAVRGEDTKRIYGRSGNSFVAVVEFGDRLQAKSLLAGGQSNDPASPHFDDQAERYAEVRFKDVPFYREDVEARAVRRYAPGMSE